MRYYFCCLLVCGFLGSTPLHAEEPTMPAVAPDNLLPNGSFEVDSTGWLLVNRHAAGTRWDLVEGDAPHGRRSLFIDQSQTVGDVRRLLIMSPWFTHAESALLVSARVRADTPCEIELGITHATIPGDVHEHYEIGPAWRRITLRVPREVNQPRDQFSEGRQQEGSSHTNSKVYFQTEQSNRRIWIDAVQVNEAPSHLGVEPPPFEPAAPVELGWRLEHGGIFHDRPRFEAVIANHGEQDWHGTLRYELRDYFGDAVQEGAEAVAVAPGGASTVAVERDGDALGFYAADLRLIGPDGRTLAEENLSMVRTDGELGSDMIAITAGVSFSDNRVDVIRSIQRLGFTQARVYHLCNWGHCAPEENEWVSRRPLMHAFLGDSDLRLLVNFQNGAEWVTEGEKYAYPLEHLDDFSDYVRRAAAELEPWLSAVCFINEPNSHFSGSDQNYCAYAQAFARAIDESVPEIDVLGVQAGSGAHVPYTRRILEVCGPAFAPSMDALAFQTHPGGHLPIEENGWERLMLSPMRALAREYGIDRLWATEMAYPVFAEEEAHIPVRSLGRGQLADVTYTERTQADRLTRAALYGLGSTFERFYAFHFQPASMWSGARYPWGMSRYNHLATPRPVLAALAVANRMIAGTETRAVRSFETPGLWGAAFSGEGRRVDALWSVAGDQHVRVDRTGGTTAFDVMGNPVSLGNGESHWLELGPSPVYLVSSSPERDPVSECIAVSWDPRTVWSGSLFRGDITVSGGANGCGRPVAWRLVDRGTGRTLWSADAPEEGGGDLSFAFDIEALPGELPLAIEADLESGRTVRRCFEAIVIGGPAERAIYESGEVAVAEDFKDLAVDGTAARSPRGITWSGEMIFPWYYDDYGKDVRRDLTATNGFLRMTVRQRVGKTARGKPNWQAIEARMDEPMNWMPYRGFRVRYRLDRRNEEGVLEPLVLSTRGIGIRLVDARGHRFFISGGSGPKIARDGDWYVATQRFDQLAGLVEHRARIQSVDFLQIWANPPANDEEPFGLSIDRIELLPLLDEVNEGRDAVMDQINFEE